MNGGLERPGLAKRLKETDPFSHSRRLRRLSRGQRGIAPIVLGIIVVVVAVVVVVGGLFAAGVLKLSSGGGGSPATEFTVTFSETGILLGGIWTVSLAGTAVSSSSSTVQFNMANGTYSYTVNATGYVPTPSSGSVTVNGAAVAKSIAFAKETTYSVVFSETGLASGTSWTVTLGGVPLSSATPTITFSEPNGTYTFTVAASGYSATPASGSLTVNGAGLSEPIAFTQVTTTYTVTFAETGLSTGATWSVTFDSVTQQSTTTSTQFTGVTNGTYSFSVNSAGYTATPATGSLTVNGAGVTETITFTTSGGSGQTYSTAAASAESATSGYQGGGWTPSIGIGVAVPSPLAIGPSNLTNTVEGCTVSWIVSPPSSITLPATSLTATAGAATAWIFYMIHPSTNATLTVDVLNGTAELLFTATGQNCEVFQTFLTEGLIDSSQAVTAANAVGGSSFLVSYPDASKQFQLFGADPTAYFNGTWSIDYTTCPIVGEAGGTGYSFNATVDATNGEVLSHTSGSAECPGYKATNYSVGFSETGLVSGTSWTATLAGVALTSTAPTITFQEPNGSYNFDVSAASYTASPPSGTIIVNGASVIEDIAFSSGGGGSSPIFSVAKAAAESAASTYEGGGWSGSVGEALALPTSISATSAQLSQFGQNCTVSWIGTEPSQVTFPATPSSASTGGSASWIFYLTQSSLTGFLLVLVLNGDATLIYTVTGVDCSSFSEFSLTDVIDSSQAVSIANSAGGSAFLSSHSVVTKAFLILGTYSSSFGNYYGEWSVVYTTCSFLQTSGSGSEFNATINATSGQLESTGGGPVSCSSGFLRANAPAGLVAQMRSSSMTSMLASPAERPATLRRR